MKSTIPNSVIAIAILGLLFIYGYSFVTGKCVKFNGKDFGIGSCSELENGKAIQIDQNKSLSLNKQRETEVVFPESGDYKAGILREVWLLDGTPDALARIPDTPPLGRMVDKEDFFKYSGIVSNHSLKSYYGSSLGMKWTGYLKVEHPGQYVFSFAIFQMKSNVPYAFINGSSMLRLKNEEIFSQNMSISTAQDGTEPQMSVVELDRGYHPLEVWLALLYPKNYNPETIRTILKVRSPKSDKPEDISRLNMIFYK